MEGEVDKVLVPKKLGLDADTIKKIGNFSNRGQTRRFACVIEQPGFIEKLRK